MDAEQIIKAILSLKQDVNYFKDFVIPLISAIISALVAFVVAYYTINKNEKSQKNLEILKYEREKIDSINKWLIILDGALKILSSLKGIYCEKLTNDPKERVKIFSIILIADSAIKEDVSVLKFINQEELSAIQSCKIDFNSVFNYVNEHNNNFKMSKSINFELIHSCETCINLIDDLIINIQTSLTKLSHSASSYVNEEVLRNYGPFYKVNFSGLNVERCIGCDKDKFNEMKSHYETQLMV